MQMLVNAPPAQAKQILGERLYALIQVEQGPPVRHDVFELLLEVFSASLQVALICSVGLQALHSAQSLHCSALSPHLVYQTPFARVKQTGGHVPEGSLNLLLESGGVTARAFSAW